MHKHLMILALLALLPVSVTAAESKAAGDGLPHAFEAGWKGEKTCEVLFEGLSLRVGLCTFPPGIGHEKHYHDPHWGYTLSGSTLRITDAKGIREVTTQEGQTWSAAVRTVHEAVNVGDRVTRYIIVEPQGMKE